MLVPARLGQMQFSLCALLLACSNCAAVGAVRPASIRLEKTPLRYSNGIASTTGPVFSADDLPEGQLLRPAQAMKGLYAAFNARDAEAVASFLTDDCVYEDLLLGPATVCRGKEAFMNALQFHPAFVSSQLLDGLPFTDLFPSLTLEIDSIAEGTDTVGIEWHVQVGSNNFPLGRGLSQAKMCTETGKIERVVDIAEAPWRVIGLAVLPFIQLFQRLQAKVQGEREPAAPGEAEPAPAPQPLSVQLGTSASASASDATTAYTTTTTTTTTTIASSDELVVRQYEVMLDVVLADGLVHPTERTLLSDFAAKNGVSGATHASLLASAGWSEEEYRDGLQRGSGKGYPD